MATMTRPDEIKAIHKQYPRLNFLALGLVVLLAGFLIGFHLVEAEFLKGDYPIGLYTEFISIIITIVVLDQINEYRETQRLKRRLVREASSTSNETAKSAIDWLRHEDWLKGKDGLLKEAYFYLANLKGAHLNLVNLKGAYLRGTNFEGAELIQANLEGADLRDVNLKGAHLDLANLKGAYLTPTNFEGARLCGANFEGAKSDNVTLSANFKGANLRSANFKGVFFACVKFEGAILDSANFKGAFLGRTNFEGANLRSANFKGANLIQSNFKGANLERATLPDGTQWTPETDMTRFTDKNHPDFWQPSDDK